MEPARNVVANQIAAGRPALLTADPLPPAPKLLRFPRNNRDEAATLDAARQRREEFRISLADIGGRGAVVGEQTSEVGHGGQRGGWRQISRRRERVGRDASSSPDGAQGSWAASTFLVWAAR